MFERKVFRKISGKVLCRISLATISSVGEWVVVGGKQREKNPKTFLFQNSDHYLKEKMQGAALWADIVLSLKLCNPVI